MSSSRDSVRGLRSGLVNVDGDEAGCSNGVTCLEAGCEGGCEVRAQVVSSRRPSDATTDSTRRIVPSPAGLHASAACTLEESKLSARFLTRSANYHARNLHPSRAIRNHKQLPHVKKDLKKRDRNAPLVCAAAGEFLRTVPARRFHSARGAAPRSVRSLETCCISSDAELGHSAGCARPLFPSCCDRCGACRATHHVVVALHAQNNGVRPTSRTIRPLRRRRGHQLPGRRWRCHSSALQKGMMNSNSIALTRSGTSRGTRVAARVGPLTTRTHVAMRSSQVTTGSGLPPGPGGLLGAVEGLSFLTAAAGLAVLGFQISDYGYVPNAVPVEGGVCS